LSRVEIKWSLLHASRKQLPKISVDKHARSVV
jgi:hypothetical protein